MTDDSLLVGNSQAMRRVRQLCALYGPRRRPVLLIGETGTGKSVVAAELMRFAADRGRPLIHISSAELTPALVQSTLAGHVKGAYTGALEHRLGLLAATDGGTVFLDDAQDLHEEVQAYLLDVLEAQAIRAVGADRASRYVVRWIVGLQEPLEVLVAAGRLRRDLAARFGHAGIFIPPLRERPEDIPPLTTFLLQRMAAVEELRVLPVAGEALRALERFSWPENVRQLDAVLYTALLTAHADGSGLIRLHHLDDDVGACGHRAQRACRGPSREAIEAALRASGNVVARAAERLGVSTRSMWRCMKRMDIVRCGADEVPEESGRDAILPLARATDPIGTRRPRHTPRASLPPQSRLPRADKDLTVGV
jgi:DNA-binding NtrC family response regulator